MSAHASKKDKKGQNHALPDCRGLGTSDCAISTGEGHQPPHVQAAWAEVCGPPPAEPLRASDRGQGMFRALFSKFKRSQSTSCNLQVLSIQHPSLCLHQLWRLQQSLPSGPSLCNSAPQSPQSLLSCSGLRVATHQTRRCSPSVEVSEWWSVPCMAQVSQWSITSVHKCGCSYRCPLRAVLSVVGAFRCSVFS